MIKQNCRCQFTAEDLVFVAKALTHSDNPSKALQSLLIDEKERDQILDDDLIYKQILEEAGCLQVSPALYFYVLTRHVLRRVGVEERDLSDYVAGVLAAFSRINQLEEIGSSSGSVTSRHFAYLSDLLAALGNAEEMHQGYNLRSHIGNYTLFLTGIFSERVRAQAERRGAPQIGFYEEIGRSSYRAVAHYPEARRAKLSEIYEQLADQFHAIRLALNDLSENVMHFHETPGLLIDP